jgi:hypothetical protein
MSSKVLFTTKLSLKLRPEGNAQQIFLKVVFYNQGYFNPIAKDMG